MKISLSCLLLCTGLQLVSGRSKHGNHDKTTKLTPFQNIEPKEEATTVNLTPFPGIEPKEEATAVNLTPFAGIEPKQEATTVNLTPFPGIEPKDGILLPCKRHGSHTQLEAGQSRAIETPRYPKHYPNRSRCRWVIHSADPTTRFKIACSDFQLQPQWWIFQFDYLRLTDYSPVSGYGWFRYTGTNGPTDWTSSGNGVQIQFFSNRVWRYRGFHCTIEAIGVTVPTTAPTTTIGVTVPTTAPTTPNEITTSSSPSCKCGRVNRGTKIVGGQDADELEYPWQVALVDYGTTNVYCGGTLINSNYVLTAGHCFGGINSANDFQVLLGAHDTRTVSSDMRLSVTSYKIHEQYDSGTLINDIALIKLSQPVSFDESTKVRPACLPPSSGNYDSGTATITGWGTLEEGGSQPFILQEVDVPLMENSKCQDYYGSSITNGMLCAGFDIGEKDSCQGDSGGPLISQNSDHYDLIGIVSWGSGCARPQLPGVYTRVTDYLSWISTNVEAGTTTCEA